MDKELLREVVRIEFSKYDPRGDKESPKKESSDLALLTAIKALADEPESDLYPEDFSAPRSFVRLYNNRGVLIESGELRRRWPVIGDSYFYTPRGEIWDLLEKIGGPVVTEPTATPPAN